MQNPPLKICPDCGQSATPDAPHCLRCGRSFPQPQTFIPQLPTFVGYDFSPTQQPGGLPPGDPNANVGMGSPGALPFLPGVPATTDASSSPNMLGAIRGSTPADNLFSMPPAVQPGPGPGAPPPWQQMPQAPPPQPWQQPSQPGNPPPPWQQPTQPIPPPWEGGPQQPSPPQPWQQASNPLSQWNQSLTAGSAGPRVVQGNRTTIALCAIFLGAFGVHKFMLGMKNPGIILLLSTVLTCGVGAMITGVIGIIEGIIYFTMTDADFNATYVQGTKEWF